MEINLDTNIRYVPYVGPQKAQLLAKLEIETVRDLLYYAPFRYQDYSLVSNINRIQAGETITIKARVKNHLNLVTKNGKKIQKATVQDNTGQIDAIWFNQPYLTRILHPGVNVYFSGTASWFGNRLVLAGPDYEIILNQKNQIHTGRLVPIYSATANLSVKWLRNRISELIDKNLHETEEYIPRDIIQKYRLMPISRALRLIHFPDNPENANRAVRRLAFEELLNMQIKLYQDRYFRQNRQKTHQLKKNPIQIGRFIKSLPFELTGDQKLAIDQINTDVAKDAPMNRILVGDVGSGKTIIAVYLMHLAAQNNLSSVMMAPTQILANQHFENVKKILGKFDTEVVLITSQNKPKKAPASGKPVVYIGTQALLTSSLITEHTGAIVIDEQQRFGVRQRQLLSEKAKIPHLLSMTATPIPRTIALTLFGNIDITMLKDMPKGRKKIKTWVVPNAKRDSGYDWIRKQILTTKTQVFIVCPFIEESESAVTVKAATQEYEHLKNHVFTGFTTGLLHGRLKALDKNRILNDFQSKKIDILVTTPVVEVGIDIPNANIMVIEGAERYGLSQLHQLRGRVGRREQEAFCLLFCSFEDNPKVVSRIKNLENHHSGLELAEIDLKIRGPGELLGVRQHGLPSFKYASFFDMDLLDQTRQAAYTLLQNDPQLENFPLLRERLIQGKIDAVS